MSNYWFFPFVYDKSGVLLISSGYDAGLNRKKIFREFFRGENARNTSILGLARVFCRYKKWWRVWREESLMNPDQKGKHLPVHNSIGSGIT